MNSWKRKAWVALAALAVVSFAMAPAQAANFTISGGTCDTSTIRVVASLGGTPDSIRWVWGDGASSLELAAPFDTTYKYSGFNGALTVEMHAWFTAVDSTIMKPLQVGVVAVPDGRNVNENDSIWINILVNDTGAVLFDSVTIVVAPQNGTATLDTDSNKVKYVPDANFNGTDVFVYRVANACGDFDTATVALTIDSDGILGIDSVWYTWWDGCTNNCDAAAPDSTISIGDSMLICMTVNAVDVDEIAAGWPKAFLTGFGLPSVQLKQHATDSTLFCYLAPPDTMFKILGGNIDVAAGFYDVIGEIKSAATNQLVADTAQVLHPIDTRKPTTPVQVLWELYRDNNGDGIAAVGDTLRFYVNFTNEPFTEICSVTLTLWDWPSTGGSVPITLTDTFGDNLFEAFYKIPAGDIDASSGTTHATKVIYSDNACNIDSTNISYSGPIDNEGPNTAAPFDLTFERLLDADSNNCLGIGDQVHIRFCDTTNTDVSAYFADMLGSKRPGRNYIMGYGSATEGDTAHVRQPFVADGANCWKIDWTLNPYPLEYAIDTTAAVAEVWVYLADDAGNADSFKIVWTDLNPLVEDIDARAPRPVVLDSCVESVSGLGDRIVTFYWHGEAPDADQFRIYWDDGTGVMDYVNAIAGDFFPADSNWSSDGEIELSWCRDYMFNLYTIDDCGNWELTHPTELLCRGPRPDPVANLTSESQDGLACGLCWDANDPSAGWFYIFMGRDGVMDYTTIIDSVQFDDTTGYYCWSSAGVVTLDEFGWYDWNVWTKDTCGNWEDIHPDSVQCLADAAPATACIFQADTACFLETIELYVCATDTSKDITSVTAWARLADTSVAADTVPGPWVSVGSASDPAGATCFTLLIGSGAFDGLVGVDTAQMIEVVFTTTDVANNVLTLEQAEAACVFSFWWSTETPTVTINTINGDASTYQPYCDLHGFEVWNGSNTINFTIEGGASQFHKVELRADDDGSTGSNDELWYDEYVTAGDHEISFDVSNWEKGLGTVTIRVYDWCGNFTSDEVEVCVPDSIPPCAEVTNPVDGKCIRRSRSMQDPVDVWVTIDPLGICLDPEDVMKVDFQWSDCCGEIGEPTITRTLDSVDVPCDGGDPGVADCDTFWIDQPGGLWDSVNCSQETDSLECWQYFWVYDTIPDTCEWATFGIEYQPVVGNETKGLGSGTQYMTWWWNTDDLAWITQSGTIIYIRAIVWDHNENQYVTECVQVCVDIDTPPLCIESPDICYKADTASVNGTIDIFANIDLATDMYDDIEEVYLYFKDSQLADRWEHWDLAGTMTPATNSTMWTYSFDTGLLTDQKFYDFRVIAKTIWGTWSYDLNGDEEFDAETFDAANCDAMTLFVDRLAPNVAIDTVWTEIDGLPIVQPNVSCELSDPRGWAWMQYGQSITVQPWIYALGNAGDVTKVEWSLWDGDCATCECSEPPLEQREPNGDLSQSIFTGDTCDWKMLEVREGAGLLDPITFNPADVPFVTVQNGYQTHVLKVRVYDGCGNWSEDCITLYILDIDPSEGIVIDPMNDEVFCQDHEPLDGGGITITAATLMAESYAKVVFYYRAAGSEDWIDFDSTTSGLSGTWYPHALGLADGAYELSVAVEDGAGNRSGPGDYITTVFLDCSAPTVALTYPTVDDPAFMGCEVDLRATATGSANNPIVQVAFYYQSVTSASTNLIGTDNYTADGSTFGYHWNPPALDGMYYIFARAWNLADVMTESEKVLVRFDGTNPTAAIIEVDGDVNGGDQLNPTVVTAGDMVDVYAWAWDKGSPSGYGATDNCGVDSVIIYAENPANKKVWGVMMASVPDVDSLYMATWNTAGLPTGTYQVWVEAWDCACNKVVSSKWDVKIMNPVPAGTIAVDEAIDCCGYPTVDGVQGLDINVAPAANATVDSIVIWRSLESASDVYDQYMRVGKLTNVIEGVWHPVVDFDPASWDEGLYRLRAQIYTGSATTEDGNSDGKFDDFTFNAGYAHHMWLMVDRTASAADFALDYGTIKAGTDVTVTVEDECGDAEYCYGVVTVNGNYGEKACMGTNVYAFDPVDSGLVSPEHGIWNGQVRVTVTDCVGNVGFSEQDLWILDINANQAAVTFPVWGAALTGDATTVTARKLSSATVDSVVFYYGTGAGTRIAKGTKSGDEFTATWNLTSVPDGMTEIWAKAFSGSTGTDGPHVHVLKAQPPTVWIDAPVPSYMTTVWDEPLYFVGGRVDLCANRDSINTLLSVGLDSVVFCYRAGDAPGVIVPDNPDPAEGWVRIAADRYGSLCVDWFTDSTLLEDPGCTDGRVAVAAWVYDKAGNVNHSNIMHVMIDNTAPYTEIHDINGDETFGSCYVVPDGQVVKISGIAIDDRSCAGDDLATNSGAKYLQFFVGDCSQGGISGCVDVVWVIDGSGSMGDDQVSIANNAALFFNALAGVDFRVGVMAYTDVANPVTTNAEFSQGGAGVGQFTTDQTTLQNMVTAVGDSGSGTENGLSALNNALDWYPWRANCNRVLILVTDEDADDMGGFDTLQPPLLADGAIIHTVIDPADSTGYSALAPGTGGQTFDITGSWGANLAAIASQIRALAIGAGNDAGIIWGQQKTLADGQTDAFALWDPSGLPEGEYCAWTVAIDQVGNTYTSQQVKICLEDEVPPVGYVAGFGTSTDTHMNHDYKVYAQTWDTDVVMAQLQYRAEGSTEPSDWTTAGIGMMVNNDSTCWMFDWDPCVLGINNLEMRVIMTDDDGNSWLNIGDAMRAAHPEWTPPVLYVDRNGCVVTIDSKSMAQTAVGFEDKTFENLGLVNVVDDAQGNALGRHHSMVGVYADMMGGLDVEKVTLWQNVGNSAAYMGSFDDSSILGGGTGLFWVAYNTHDANATTYLGHGMLTVWHVEADLGFPGTVTDAAMGASVTVFPNSVAQDNGVVLFPARAPFSSLAQQHYEVYPNAGGMLTAIRFTEPMEGGFATGYPARVSITYDESELAEGITEDDLQVAWWNPATGNWTIDGLQSDPEGGVEDGTATFLTHNLFGIYAVVSAGRACNSGALTVAHMGQKKGYNSWTGPKPTIYTIVKSNIEGENGNIDINSDEITVVLDRGTNDELVLWANGEAPSNGFYTNAWDNITGVLTTRWNSAAPPLDEGDHTLWVQAFNNAGYCKSMTWEFTVDATEPDVVVTGKELCQNPVFEISIHDMGAGVDWDSVYVDVYDITASDPYLVPKSRLMHTETPDAFQNNGTFTGDDFSFELVMHTAQERRLKIVIYNGTRYEEFNENCDCEYYLYDHDVDGVPDLAGNHTEVVEEFFTVSGPCGGSDSDEPKVEIAEGSYNPFNPDDGEGISFSLNGFSGAGAVKVTVYDLAGERVKTIHHDAIGGAAATVHWDGYSDDLEPVAEGVYLIHFQATGGAASGPLSQVLKIVVQRPN